MGAKWTYVQAVYEDMPDNLMPKNESVKNYLFSHLPRNEGAAHEYTFQADETAMDDLNDILQDFLDDRKRDAQEGRITRTEAAAQVRGMRTWVANMKNVEEPFDIDFR